MKKMSVRTRVLITMLPFAVIPILIVALVSSQVVKKRMLQQSESFYSNIIVQVNANLDFYYNQYAISLADFISTDAFQKTINRPQAKTQLEEKNKIYINGVSVTNLMRNFLVAKFKGDFLLLEFDKHNITEDKPYLYNRYSVNDIEINVDKFRNDPVFKTMESRMNTQPVLGITGQGVMSGYEIEKRPIFFFPYIKDGEKQIKRVLFIVESTDFLKELYIKNTNLKYGTLYIIDMFGNVMATNHPGYEDYYEYNAKEKKYVLSPGDSLNDPDEKMSFAEYRMLNTDQTILEAPQIAALVNDERLDDEDVISEIKNYQGRSYLTLVAKSPLSGVKLVYFQPVSQIFIPIAKMINLILIISLIIIGGLSLISIFVARFFTAPIIDLTKGAGTIKAGDYKVKLKTERYFGEFLELADTFNSMMTTIQEYNDHLEELVEERTEELNTANEELFQANSELTIVNEKNKKELVMAQKIQSALIPKIFPNSNLLKFSAMYLPMEALGGDLYDVYKISDYKFGIMILDVCGHGVPAALITTMAKISFSSNSRQEQRPDKVLALVNDELCDAIQGTGDYLTAFYCVVDMENNTLEYSNGGHNEMLLMRNDGDIIGLKNNGPVVGVFKEMPFGYEKIDLHDHDRLILYTDGVIEARDIQKNLYDTARLIRIIKENRNRETKEFVKTIFDDIMQFKSGTPHNDDIAILVADVVDGGKKVSPIIQGTREGVLV